MNNYRHQLIILAKRLLLLVVIFQLCRIAFYFANYSYFNSTAAIDVLIAFFAGLRFDLSTIISINFIFIFIHIIPGLWFYNKNAQLVLKILFLVVNIPAILLNCVDLEYFKFQGKRTTADLFHLFGMGEDMKNTIPKMIVDFWYVLLIFLVLVILLIYGYNRIRVGISTAEPVKKLKALLLCIGMLALAIVGSRGGIQYKPLGIMAAARYTKPQLVPLVLNTPFTVYKTYGKALIEEKNYMSHEEALQYFNKDHHFKNREPFKKLNVVLVILESFSSEYIGAFNNGKGYTPFLDSLMHAGMTFDNAYANAKKSIDGIPAVLASMPTLMSVSYISSPYNSNKLKSVAGILKSKGYSSAFFHGGNNGTMNFDNFTLLTGFDKYYGRKEYPGNDYDGHWGVFDEPFYYFFIKKCNEMNEPFVTTFYTLSSHHPYSLPDSYKNKFPKGNLPIHESIGYADYALRCFFDKAKSTSWYNNTLFVLTADHTGPASTPYYNSKSGMFRVPIVFYHPGSNLKGWSGRVTQQTDLVPGILDYLNYDEPFTAFGQSMFDTTVTPFAANFAGDVYQVLSDDLLVHFDGSDVAGSYKYRTDSFLLKNVAAENSVEQQQLVKVIKSELQQYNRALIRNELIPSAIPK